MCSIHLNYSVYGMILRFVAAAVCELDRLRCPALIDWGLRVVRCTLLCPRAASNKSGPVCHTVYPSPAKHRVCVCMYVRMYVCACGLGTDLIERPSAITGRIHLGPQPIRSNSYKQTSTCF